MYVIMCVCANFRYLIVGDTGSNIFNSYDDAFDMLTTLWLEDDSEGECKYRLMQLTDCG